MLEKWCSHNEIIVDYDKLFNQANKYDDIRKEKVVNERDSHNDQGEKHNKLVKSMNVIQIENGRLWEIKKSYESTKEVKNYKSIKREKRMIF